MGREIMAAVALTLLVAPLSARGGGNEGGDQTASADSGDDAGQGAQALRIRDLEDRVNRLKADYNLARYRLALLAEKYLNRKLGGARAELTFRNETGPLLDLERVVITMDGEVIYLRVDEDGVLDEDEQIPLFLGPVAPGDHVLGVALEYRGQGLPYVDGYLVKVRSSHAFTVEPGQALELDVIGYEKGKLEPLVERPAIRYVERISDDD